MKLTFYLVLMAIGSASWAQKLFHHQSSEPKWQYIYPFKNKRYVFAIQREAQTGGSNDGLENFMLYYGKKGTTTDRIFWKEKLRMRFISDNVNYEDFNNDGVKDILLFKDTGGRGGNVYYNLFLTNEKDHTLKKVTGFNEITNPTYNKKHKVILGYGYAGSNYYSIYRIDKNNKVYKIGKSFEDNHDLDLDQKIAEVLKRRE